jgi:hypothetical protein
MASFIRRFASASRGSAARYWQWLFAADISFARQEHMRVVRSTCAHAPYRIDRYECRARDAWHRDGVDGG